MKQKKPTLRMCCVCRQMKDKSQLIRVVKNKQGEVFVDESAKASGRGAFVCKDRECIEKCKKTRAINRAFKGEVPTEVYESLARIEIDVTKSGAKTSES